MLKKTMVIVFMCLSVILLLQNQSMAALNPRGGGWGWGSYFAEWLAGGGAKPTVLNEAVLFSEFEVENASLACKNNNDFDVRNWGKGGLSIHQEADLANAEDLGEREQGRFRIKTPNVCSNADELNCDKQIFNQLSWEQCRNKNWEPYQYMIQSGILTGEIQDCSTGTCVPISSSKSYYCETDTPTRTIWLSGVDACDPNSDPYCTCYDPGDGSNFCKNVTYLCVDLGFPIVWADTYNANLNGGPTRVKDRGVLTNDHDTGDNPTYLSVARVDAYDEDGVYQGETTVPSDGLTFYTQSGGKVFISPNGGFTVSGLTSADFFRYKAVDEEDHLSDWATVTLK